MADTEQWYYNFDSQTYEFIPGAVHEKTEYNTAVEPTGFYGLPKWNPNTQAWEGELMTDYLASEKAKYEAEQASQVDPEKQKAAQILQMLVAQKAEIAALQAQINAKTVTASQAASQSTSTSVSGGATNA